MQHRLLDFSLLALWGLIASPVIHAADSGQLLAQLERYDIVSVSQAQVLNFGTATPNFDTASPSNPVYLKQLLGLYVDGLEQPALTAVYDGRQYLLPLLPIMDAASISISEDADEVEPEGIRVVTPGGEAILEMADLRVIEGQVMVLQSALIEKLFIDTRYDQASFAIFLELPWNRAEVHQTGNVVVSDPDFTPPSASIRNLRADLNYVSTDSYDGWTGDYFAAGNLAGGTWRFRADQDSNGNARPFDYYWARNFTNSQILAGNSDFSLHPLLNTIEQTGIQFLYSSSVLPQTTSSNITRPYSARGIANGVRNIEGVATPGSVAELRVDGGVVARTRVRLDGTYDFLNVELPTRGYSEILVHVLDRSAGTLMDVQNFSRRSGIELLSDGQHTAFVTLGQQGNPLDAQYSSLGVVNAAQWRHGLTEDLTMELGHQRVGDLEGTQAALSMALFNSWFGSLGYATTFDRDALELDLEGGGELWSVDFTAREYEMTGALESGEDRRQWSRFFTYRYQVTDNLNLGIVGRDINTNYETTNFVLPSANWSNRKNFTVSAYPNIGGDYRVDSSFSPTRYDTARYAFERDRHLIDYRRRDGRGQEYYANYSAGESQSDRLELGLVHYSENPLLGRAQVGLVSNGGRLGYTLDWESNFFPGFNSRLRLAKGGYDVGIYKDEEKDELYLQWHMTLDFAVAQNRIIPADSNWGSFESAALSGEVMLGDRRVVAGDNIDQIELIIDGNSYTALVQGGRYYIDGLEPGLHKISMDSRFLPIELMPGDNQDYWVRLEAAAATEVPLKLEARYAIAGRVRNVDGENVVGLQLIILNDSGRKVGEAYTDQYGLYRADSLAPGEYYVVAQENGERLSAIEVEIADAFLFEQDLLVP